MADTPFHSNIDLLGASVIKNGGWEKLAADPSTPTEGQLWFNTTDGDYKYYLNGTVHVVATEAYVNQQLLSIERYQGGYDASGAALPDITDKTEGDLSNLVPGDYWTITTAGTYTGLQGDNTLQVGDSIKYLTGDPTLPASWVGVNAQDSAGGSGGFDRQVVNLVAGTPLTVSSTTIDDIHSIQVYDSTGREIRVCVEKGPNANQRILESTVTASNVTVELVGVAA